MRADKASREGVVPGTILQINPTAGDIPGAGGFCVVEEVNTWGVKAYVQDHGLRPVAWSEVEKTGGRAIWDGQGVRLREPEEPMRHHP